MSADAFDWDDLRYFLAVARSGRLTEAARRMEQDHATVSRRISALEQDLGSRLFDRTPTGYLLTEAGKSLLPRAEAIESAALRFLVGAAEVQSLEAKVVLSVPDGFGEFFLSICIGKLCARYPALQPQVLEHHAIDIHRCDADLILCYERPLDGPFVAQKLCDVAFGLYASKEYLESSPPIRTVQSLAAHRTIGPLDDRLEKTAGPALRTFAPTNSANLRFSSVAARAYAAVNGQGLCLLPHFIGRSINGLHAVPVQDARVQAALWSIVHVDRRKLAPVRAVRDFIHVEARALRSTLL